MSSHPDLAKLAFTGSGATGRHVNLAAANNLRPATLELGGKSALIIFEDVDLPSAVEWAMFGGFWTNGQMCSATSRLLLQESIAPQFFALLKQRAESIKVGNPSAKGCRLGPIVSKKQYERVMGYIQSGVLREAGATVTSS